MGRKTTTARRVDKAKKAARTARRNTRALITREPVVTRGGNVKKPLKGY